MNEVLKNWLRNKSFGIGKKFYNMGAKLGKDERLHKCEGRCPSVETDRPLDREIGEKIFRLKGIGYYGPTKESGDHTDYVLCKTGEEARDLYKKHWRGGIGFACWKEIDVKLDFWVEGWGPQFLPEFSTSLYDSEKVVERMLGASFSYSCYRVPSISSFAWGWTCSFRYGVQPPERMGAEDQWSSRSYKKPYAVCQAALLAYDNTLNYNKDDRGSGMIKSLEYFAEDKKSLWTDDD